MAMLREVLRNFTFANQLTFLRLIAVPFFIIAILTNRPGIALALFIAAAITDWFDGLIARFLKQTTALGAFLDPIADKLLMTAAFICLTIPDHPKLLPEYIAANHVPIQLTILTISRDTFIIMTAILLYVVYGVAKFPPTVLGKITTFAEAITIGLFLLYNTLEKESVVVLYAVWITLTLVVVSGFHYIYRSSSMIRDAQKKAGHPS
jgi:cardiolipin synthase (CMP-forming)